MIFLDVFVMLKIIFLIKFKLIKLRLNW